MNEIGKLMKPMIHNRLFKKDQKLNSKLSPDLLKEVKKYKRPIAKSTVTMERSNFQLGNIVTFCIKEKLNADIAIINYGVLRSSILPGVITIEDIKILLPFDHNRLSLVYVKGEQIKRMIKLAIESNNKLLRLNGLWVDYEKIDSKIVIKEVLLANKEPIENEKEYKIASRAFLLEEFKDGFAGIKDKEIYNVKDVQDTGLFLFDVVSECIETQIKTIDEDTHNYETFHEKNISKDMIS